MINPLYSIDAFFNPKINFVSRDYFQQRTRGEFLTRGAALASQQAEFGPLATAPNSARGSMASHLDATGVMGGGGNSAVYSVGQRTILTSEHEQLEREPRR